jgi:hypothetical protein
MGNDADELLKGVTIAVIGPVTAKAVENAELHVDIMPEEATIEAMVEEIIKWVLKGYSRRDSSKTVQDFKVGKKVNKILDEPS